MNEQIIKESFSLAKKDIQTNSEEITSLKKQIIQLKNHIYVLEEKAGTKKITEEPNDLKDTLRDVLKEMQRVSTQKIEIIDKKDAMKKKIIEYINNKEVDLPRLKQIFVNENQYCSKASFYRYIDELKRENKINPTKQKVMVI